MTPLKPTASKVLAAAAAKGIWKHYGLQSPSDFELEDLAFAMGIVVMEGPLRGADAWLLRKQKAGIIRVSDSIPEPGRRRFAVAHELGHWSLHEKASQLVSCTSDDMVAKYKGSPLELEANYFAAELLMPQQLFSAAIKNQRPTAQLVNDLADTFRTSRTATAIRIADVSTDYFAVVSSEKGIIKWWQASDELREKIWIEPGAPVPRYSIAAQFFRDEALPGKPEKVDLAPWLSENRGLDDEYIFEDIITMPQYGQVLSLLWLQ